MMPRRVAIPWSSELLHHRVALDAEVVLEPHHERLVVGRAVRRVAAGSTSPRTSASASR